MTKYALSDSFWPSHTTIILMNKKKFDGLPDDIQKALIDAQIENEGQMAEMVSKLEEQERQKLESSGMTFTKLPPDEAKEWRRISADARFEDIEGKMPAERIELIRSMIVRH